MHCHVLMLLLTLKLGFFVNKAVILIIYFDLQLNIYVFDVAPISLVVIIVTVYTPPVVMLKLQPVVDGVRLEHSSDALAGPSTSMVTVSIGGVYLDDDWVPY